MQREAVTTQQIEEWKKTFEKYKTLLVPNRKTGQELVDYITSKFNVNKFEDDDEDLWDELCAFQGLDEDDLNNYYCVAEYINCLKKFDMLESVLKNMKY